MKNKDKWCEYIFENVSTPFEFGKHDCCLTACNLLQISTGKDAAESFRGTYDNAVGMFITLKKNGGVEAIADRICKELGWKEISPLFATKGDLVMVDAGSDRQALMVVDLNGSELIGAGPIGFTRKPLSDGIKAWRTT
jgi:hypothetical protein